MNLQVDTTINVESCIGCGNCVKVCIKDALSIVDGKAKVTGEETLGCDHCVAACPVDCVDIGFVDDDALQFETLEDADKYLKPGEFDTDGLVNLMRSRRSCRNYKEKQVPLSVLKDLVKIGITAPSATNSQLWTFTIVPERKKVLEFGTACLGFFKKLNSMAEKPHLRFVAKIFKKDVLNEYWNNYYASVKESVDQFEKDGTDRLFHNAQAAIIVGSEPGASCPLEDAMLATQNILLAAHSMGLGTCLIGFAVEAIKNQPSIKADLKIPAKEKVHAVIALGYPDEKFYRPTRRKRVVPRVV